MTTDLKDTSKPLRTLPERTTSSLRLVALGIPNSFKLLNHTITIKEIPDLPDSGRYGDYDGDRNEIRLYTAGVVDSVIVHTFYHELYHAFEDKGNLADISDEEVRCDVFGGLMAQYIDTKR